MILASRSKMHFAESTHWYTLDGQPCYEVKAAKGGMRPTTLRDARKLNLVPSVTTIIKMAAAPGLENWKAEQLLMAALTLPRIQDEPESAWLDRVRNDSREQARKAAERGTAIHASLQGYFDKDAAGVNTDHWPYVDGTAKALKNYFSRGDWFSEQSFAHPLGFGGKCDLYAICNPQVVCDFKTKEFTADNLPKTWDDYAMQLAAYRHGFGMERARCAIVFVSVSVPGLCHIVELDQTELTKGWNCFKALLEFWQAKNDYRPDFDKQAA